MVHLRRNRTWHADHRGLLCATIAPTLHHADPDYTNVPTLTKGQLMLEFLRR